MNLGKLVRYTCATICGKKQDFPWLPVRIVGNDSEPVDLGAGGAVDMSGVTAAIDALTASNAALLEQLITLNQPVEVDMDAYVTVWAEQNGVIQNNRWSFSFGNGNEHNGAGVGDWGFVTHYPYEVISMSVGMRATNTAATAIMLTADGADTAAILTVPGSTTKGVAVVSHSGPAGDALNFKTVTAGGANDVVVSIVIKYTLP